MSKDLETLEEFLKEQLSWLKDSKDWSRLKNTFAFHARHMWGGTDFKHAPFLKSLMPPEGQGGNFQDIVTHWPEFSLCLYYDRMDVFWDERLQDRNSEEKRYYKAMGARVQEFKQQPLDEEQLARRILAGHVIYDLVPKSAADRKKPLHIGAAIARGSLSPAEEAESFFTKQKAGDDYSIVPNVSPNGWSYMPQSHLSSYLAYLRVNPKMHLIASDFTKQIFGDDGVFFEGANFRYANLRFTQWDTPRETMKGIYLEGAILQGADGLYTGSLTEEDLAHAYIDETTVLPKGFNYERIMEMHRALKMPPAPPITDFELEHRNVQRYKLIEKTNTAKNQPSPPEPSKP
jgi:hypothetical protein